MSLPTRVFATPAALGRSLAAEILEGAAAARRGGRRFLLGCPGGRSLRSTYDELARQAGEAGADLSRLVVVMMDEYLRPANGGFAYCPDDAHYSCRRFAEAEIRAPLDRALPAPARVPRANVWLPDPVDPAAFDARLAAAGGVDLFLLATGASDGHVAFNPPGTGLDSVTRVVRLADSTRRDNLATFPDFRGLGEVPTHGVSVGLGTIARLSRAVALVAHGAHKAAAVRRLLAATEFTPDWPATVVHACRDARLLLDRAAAPPDAT